MKLQAWSKKNFRWRAGIILQFQAMYFYNGDICEEFDVDES